MSKLAIHSMVIAMTAALSSAAMAGGMAGYPEVRSQGPGVARAQVVEEMIAFKRNPVVGDWKMVDSEAGWVLIGNAGEGKSRAEVVRELETFQRDRAAQAKHSELYGAS